MPDQRRRPAGPPKRRPSRLLDDLAMEVDVETFDLGLSGHPGTERHVAHLEDDEAHGCGPNPGRDVSFDLYPDLPRVAHEEPAPASSAARRSGEPPEDEGDQIGSDSCDAKERQQAPGTK